MASYIHAGLRRHYDVVKYLIDAGADLAAPDGYAIHYAGEVPDNKEVVSFSVGVMKPDREIYELACSRMCVQLSEAYFVGDGGYDELQGAASLGMRTIQATWYQDRDVEWSCTSPLVRANSIRDLPELLC